MNATTIRLANGTFLDLSDAVSVNVFVPRSAPQPCATVIVRRPPGGKWAEVQTERVWCRTPDEADAVCRVAACEIMAHAPHVTVSTEEPRAISRAITFDAASVTWTFGVHSFQVHNGRLSGDPQAFIRALEEAMAEAPTDEARDRYAAMIGYVRDLLGGEP